MKKTLHRRHKLISVPSFQIPLNDFFLSQISLFKFETTLRFFFFPFFTLRPSVIVFSLIFPYRLLWNDKMLDSLSTYHHFTKSLGCTENFLSQLQKLRLYSSVLLNYFVSRLLNNWKSFQMNTDISKIFKKMVMEAKVQKNEGSSFYRIRKMSLPQGGMGLARVFISVSFS